jgi:hypothetical protein
MEETKIHIGSTVQHILNKTRGIVTKIYNFNGEDVAEVDINGNFARYWVRNLKPVPKTKSVASNE